MYRSDLKKMKAGVTLSVSFWFQCSPMPFRCLKYAIASVRRSDMEPSQTYSPGRVQQDSIVSVSQRIALLQRFRIDWNKDKDGTSSERTI